MPDADIPEASEDSIGATTSSSPLDKAGDFAKYLTALATGALVFSAELLKKDYVLPKLSRHIILGSWICLALAALFGLAALARIPMMMEEQSQDLDDALLKWPLRGQQVCLALGIIALGISLVLTLWNAPVATISEQTPPQSEESISHHRFDVVSSAKHVLGKMPPHWHTFLLDHDTGRIWEMSCDSSNKVRFRAVEVEGLMIK
jgi:hypothetical protein